MEAGAEAAPEGKDAVGDGGRDEEDKEEDKEEEGKSQSSLSSSFRFSRLFGRRATLREGEGGGGEGSPEETGTRK